MADVKFYATISDENDTLEATIHAASDDDVDCEICDQPLNDGQLLITTNSYPYDYNSAVTVHFSCFDTNGLIDLRLTP